ncbi:MAG: ABC transporter ATP-binding protein [Saprospiraceae bacterium]|nr:ABC transporter ATP-binding protein [Saprospiraceae bacterium]
MDLVLNNISKRFAFQTILSNIDVTFSKGSTTGISGRNGSGKSTLLKIVSGHMSPSVGNITYSIDNQPIPEDAVYKHLVFSAPYIDLPPYFSINELLTHYRKFKNVKIKDTQEFIDYCELPQVKDKHIGFFSSGMKQKVSIALALNTQTSLLMLDEPTSYFDQEAKSWFYNKLSEIQNTTTIIASNEKEDFKTASRILELKDKYLIT